jgi:5-methylcytosine-specific restriction enzyme A
MTIDFEVGKIYDRRKDIHSRFGGQQQGGIATSSQIPAIFLFTGESGKQYGYEDDWGKDNVFLYTGEGQIGDMQFIRGNKAIRDHIPNGKDLLLFRSLGKSKGYRYVGEFICNSWEYQIRPDLQGQTRKAIVFHLVLPNADTALPSIGEETGTGNFVQLREKALAAGSEATEALSKDARHLYYQRSAIVRAYVLARAAGKCESCLRQAPFLRPDGTPYLEPHHTKRLSDGGPDNPRSVAAICPNCHRRIHHGKDGLEMNQALQEYLVRVEEEIESQ